MLAKCLSDQREPVAALRAYEARRSKVGQWEQPLLCSLRDGLIPLAFATVLPKLFVANLSNGPHPDA